MRGAAKSVVLLSLCRISANFAQQIDFAVRAVV